MHSFFLLSFLAWASGLDHDGTVPALFNTESAKRERERDVWGLAEIRIPHTQNDPPEFEVRSKQVASLVGLRTGCLTF